MKIKNLITLIIICTNTSFAFSQVIVKYKYNGIFKEVEYKTYEDCGCKKWAADFYKNGETKSWGMESNNDKEALEAVIKQKINNDYTIWKKAVSNYENYVIYCADTKLGNNYREVNNKKVSSTDGILIEEVSTDNIRAANEKAMQKQFDRIRKKVLTNDSAQIKRNEINYLMKKMEDNADVNSDTHLRVSPPRADNTKSKIEVESMGITTEKKVKPNKKATTKKN